MTLLLIALLVALAAATGIVLADSGLRMWSAAGGIKAQRAMLSRQPAQVVPALRSQRTARVMTRVSFARTAAVAPLRAAA